MIRRILTPVLLLLALTTSAQISPPERSPVSLHARFGVMFNDEDLALKMNSKTDTTQYRTINTGYMAVPEVALNIDFVRYRSINIGLQLSAIVAQPGLHVKGGPVEYLAGVTDMYMAKGTLWLSINTSGEPYSMFSLPYHGQGESIIGFTAAVMDLKDIDPTQQAQDSLGITRINGNTNRAVGFTFGWNWRLGQSGWVLGMTGSLMWHLQKNYLINFESTPEAPYTSGTLPFEPRILTGGIGYHF